MDTLKILAWSFSAASNAFVLGTILYILLQAHIAAAANTLLWFGLA